MEKKKLTLDELKLGMMVYKEQLSEIMDTWIILVKNKSDKDMQGDGIVSFIGKETNSDSDKLYTPENIITPIYNDSTELEGDIYYDE